MRIRNWKWGIGNSGSEEIPNSSFRTPHSAALGVAKGLAVTARNLVGSYTERDRMVTEQYPEQRPTIPEASRTFPFLVYDGTDPEAGMRCVACKICEKECPTNCIRIVQDRDPAGKLLKRPQIFNIDISVCMGCRACVDACPFESIRMDSAFEFAAFDRFESLLLTKDRLLKSNSYYHCIHPTEAAETDARIETDRKKKAAAAAAKAAKAEAAA